MPMKTLKLLIQKTDRQVAQSMVEFALALPVLLLLVFGIIEFGRILQAWLALENGARFGVRYAVTGNFDPDYCQYAVTALATDLALTADQQLDAQNDCEVMEEGQDGIMGTPDDRVDQDLTDAIQDWARMPSIRDAALAGAMGIAWDPDPNISGDYVGFLTNALTTADLLQDFRGNPSEPGYFNVAICSNRVVPPNADIYGINPNPFYYLPNPGGTDDAYRFPDHCELVNSATFARLHAIDDAGGPGDRVRVVLTYRHNLITPFLSSWWPTLRLTAAREGLVERFRTSRITGLIGGMIAIPTITFTNPPPTLTPTVTETLTPTVTEYRHPHSFADADDDPYPHATA